MNVKAIKIPVPGPSICSCSSALSSKTSQRELFFSMREIWQEVEWLICQATSCVMIYSRCFHPYQSSLDNLVVPSEASCHPPGRNQWPHLATNPRRRHYHVRVHHLDRETRSYWVDHLQNKTWAKTKQIRHLITDVGLEVISSKADPVTYQVTGNFDLAVLNSKTCKDQISWLSLWYLFCDAIWYCSTSARLLLPPLPFLLLKKIKKWR